MKHDYIGVDAAERYMANHKRHRVKENVIGVLIFMGVFLFLALYYVSFILRTER